MASCHVFSRVDLSRFKVRRFGFKPYLYHIIKGIRGDPGGVLSGALTSSMTGLTGQTVC